MLHLPFLRSGLRMNAPRLAAVLLALVALAPATTAASGPFRGSVREGETDVHAFDNHPKSGSCIQITTTYTVTLVYAPGSDALTLDAGGKTDVGSGGSARVSFESGVCTAFSVRVTGTSVADEASYAVFVTSSMLGSIGDWS